MKSLILILAIIAVSTATQKDHLKFSKMYKKGINNIVAPPKLRIIGGHEAEPHSMPYQAFLEFRSANYVWYCGGSLVSQNYLLTAAQCCDTATKVIVTLGAHNLSTSENSQYVSTSEDMTIHYKYYDYRLVNDICAVKLPRPITFTQAIQPVALPSLSSYDNTYEGSIARVGGWGYINGSVDEMADVLNYVDLPVINNRQCEKVYGFLMPSILCTSGVANNGPCTGDSGGPLVVNGVQIGIGSFTYTLCIKGFPAGFTRITRFLDWIEFHTDVIIM